MVTTRKKPQPAASKPRKTSAAGPPVKTAPAAKAATAARTKPFLRYYQSDALRKETLRVLALIEKAPDPTRHRDALADNVVAMTSAGMDYYFIRPLKLSDAGFLTEQSANLGMAGAMQVLGSVIRNIIGRMEGPQLLSVSASIRELMK